MDLLHVGYIESVKLGGGNGLELVEALGEFGVEARLDGYSCLRGDVLESGVYAFVVVRFEGAEILDDRGGAFEGGDFAGFYFVEAAL